MHPHTDQDRIDQGIERFMDKVHAWTCSGMHMHTVTAHAGHNRMDGHLLAWFVVITPCAHTRMALLQLNDEAFKNEESLHSDVSGAAEFLWTRLVKASAHPFCIS